MIDDIIVAIATPYGKNGIGVVRVSGKGSLDLARKIFRAYKNDVKFEPNYMVLGNIELDKNILDKGFLVYFKAPKSYTGEDVVEIQCHGGIVVTQKIVERLVSLGARIAMPGEFSKRAFLNGKMSLDEAEGVIDTINAESESDLRASSELARGSLFNEIKKYQNELTDLISEIEVNLDYPEQDIEYATKEKLSNGIKDIKQKIDKLVATKKQGKIVRNGVNVAIVGKTNAGKSSLLNAILGTDQAIVTDIAGTTRDVVVGNFEYRGIKFNFLDTAGLRQTKDKVESIGIEKSKQAINESDIVLFVVDGSKDFDEQDKENLKLLEDKKTIVVVNKSDLEQVVKLKNNFIKISAKNKTNIDELKEKIYQMAMEGCDYNATLVLTNARHLDILCDASELAKKIVSTCMDLPLDCVALDIRELWNKLGEITGESSTEEIVDRIFEKFCLGK